MEISAKTDYAVRALLSLAARQPELVKVDPKSIGVGQYQHDIDQYRLDKLVRGQQADQHGHHQRQQLSARYHPRADAVGRVRRRCGVHADPARTRRRGTRAGPGSGPHLPRVLRLGSR